MTSVVQFEKRGFNHIHQDAVRAAQDLKSKYLRLFEVLLEVEQEQIYYQFEVPSLYIYCLELLELSPSTARDFVIVVRKALELKPLKDAVLSGRITISKARKICPVIDEKSSKEWIELAEYCSCRIVEKAVAQARPREAIIESMKYVSGDVLELKLAVGEKWRELLVETKDLLSQKMKKAVSTEEALQTLMQDFCEKESPIRKAERALKKKEKVIKTRLNDSQLPTNRVSATKEQTGAPELIKDSSQMVSAENLARAKENVRDHKDQRKRLKRSRYIDADTRYKLTLNSENQCMYIDMQGKRCTSKRWLDIHHKKPFAEGGKNTIDNLEILCSAHHRIKHLRDKIHVT